MQLVESIALVYTCRFRGSIFQFSLILMLNEFTNIKFLFSMYKHKLFCTRRIIRDLGYFLVGVVHFTNSVIYNFYFYFVYVWKCFLMHQNEKQLRPQRKRIALGEFSIAPNSELLLAQSLSSRPVRAGASRCKPAPVGLDDNVHNISGSWI